MQLLPCTSFRPPQPGNLHAQTLDATFPPSLLPLPYTRTFQLLLHFRKQAFSLSLKHSSALWQLTFSTDDTLLLPFLHLSRSLPLLPPRLLAAVVERHESPGCHGPRFDAGCGHMPYQLPRMWKIARSKSFGASSLGPSCPVGSTRPEPHRT